MWKEAIKSEIDFILHYHAWELVDLPSGCKSLSSKWVFKRKKKVDRSIDKYKARLVIKGYKCDSPNPGGHFCTLFFFEQCS